MDMMICRKASISKEVGLVTETCMGLGRLFKFILILCLWRGGFASFGVLTGLRIPCIGIGGV